MAKTALKWQSFLGLLNLNLKNSQFCPSYESCNFFGSKFLHMNFNWRNLKGKLIALETPFPTSYQHMFDLNIIWPMFAKF
jgi:hypothetical protein